MPKLPDASLVLRNVIAPKQRGVLEGLQMSTGGRTKLNKSETQPGWETHLGKETPRLNPTLSLAVHEFG